MLLGNILILFKETIIYGIASASISIVSFLLLPLYTNYLTPQDYGYLSLLTTYQSIIEITASFGLSSGFFRYYIMAENDTKKREVLSTCFLTQFLFVLIIALLISPFRSSIAGLLFKDTHFAGSVTIVSFTAFSSAISTLFFSLLRAKRKTVLFAVIQISKVIALAVLNIVFVVFLKMNYRGVIFANALTMIISACVIMLIFRREYSFTFSPVFFKTITIIYRPRFPG